MKHQPLLNFPDPAPGMTRRALAKQQTRTRLLGAARAVFASFSDKADLFNEVIIADCEALFQQMAAVEDAGSAADTLLRLLSLGYDQHQAQLPLTQAALG